MAPGLRVAPWPKILLFIFSFAIISSHRKFPLEYIEWNVLHKVQNSIFIHELLRGMTGSCASLNAAPEVLLGRAAAEAADIWSVGAITFTLCARVASASISYSTAVVYSMNCREQQLSIAHCRLSGNEPFDAADQQERYRNVLKCRYDFESTLWDSITSNAKVS